MLSFSTIWKSIGSNSPSRLQESPSLFRSPLLHSAALQLLIPFSLSAGTLALHSWLLKRLSLITSVPTNENRYIPRLPNCTVTRRNEPDKCEICRTEVYDPVDPVCNHVFCRRCLAKYRQCPIDGMSLHQAHPDSQRPQQYVPVERASSSRNFDIHDRAVSSQTEITTVTKTTHTSSKTLPYTSKPVQQLRDERWSETPNTHTRHSILEDRSQTMQRTRTQTQMPQHVSAPIKDTKAEIYIDADRMIQVMFIEANFICYYRDYFSNYLDVMRDVSRRWRSELWKRDGLTMLRSDFLNMLEMEMYEIFDGRESRPNRPDIGEMPVGLKHAFHRIALSIVKMYPQCRRVQVEDSIAS